MIELLPAITVEFVAEIIRKPRAIERAVEQPIENLLTLIDQHETRGAGTLLEDGVPIAAGGITVVKHPLAFCWLVASKDLRPYLRHVLPAVKRAIADASDLHLWATITDGQPTAERFARKMGFTPGPKYSLRTTNYFFARKHL